MFLAQEPKYMAIGSQIVNRATGKPVRDPVIIFRAQDKLAPVALAAYVVACRDNGLDHQAEVVQARLDDFTAWAASRPDAMKLPDTTLTRHTPATHAGWKALVPGHTYEVSGGHIVQFLKKEKLDGEFITTAPGTTNEELIEVLMDRIKHLNATLPYAENNDALLHLAAAHKRLLDRTAARIAQQVEATPQPHVNPNSTLVEQYGIEMIPCKSSNLEAYGYDKAGATLALRFKGGAIYHYAGVPEHVAQALANAASIGSYASREITGKFEGVRMNEPTGAVAA
ncbi:MAG: KTSC domain-containing protein [Proteobacteria bacterium]|nr:KTSC domain-containing protein [Pseudomonadota bacterium]